VFLIVYYAEGVPSLYCNEIGMLWPGVQNNDKVWAVVLGVLS